MMRLSSASSPDLSPPLFLSSSFSSSSFLYLPLVRPFQLSCSLLLSFSLRSFSPLLLRYSLLLILASSLSLSTLSYGCCGSGQWSCGGGQRRCRRRRRYVVGRKTGNRNLTEKI